MYLSFVNSRFWYGCRSSWRALVTSCTRVRHVDTVLVATLDSVMLRHAAIATNTFEFQWLTYFYLMPRADTIDLILLSVQCPGLTQSTWFIYLSNSQGRHNRPDFNFCSMPRADTVDMVLIPVQWAGPTQSTWLLFLFNAQGRQNRLGSYICPMPRADTIDLIFVSVQCPGLHNRLGSYFCSMPRADTIDLIFVSVQCPGLHNRLGSYFCSMLRADTNWFELYICWTDFVS